MVDYTIHLHIHFNAFHVLYGFLAFAFVWMLIGFINFGLVVGHRNADDPLQCAKDFRPIHFFVVVLYGPLFWPDMERFDFSLWSLRPGGSKEEQMIRMLER